MSYHPHVRTGDTISGHGLKRWDGHRAGDTISGHAFHGMQGAATALGPNQQVPAGPPLQAGPVMKFSAEEIDAAMVRLTHDVLTDVLANAAYLELTEVRPYERIVHGRLEDVSGYQNRFQGRELLDPAGRVYRPRTDIRDDGFVRSRMDVKFPGSEKWYPQDGPYADYADSHLKPGEATNAVDVTEGVGHVPDIPESEARYPEVYADEGVDPAQMHEALAALLPGVRDELARAGVRFHATSARTMSRDIRGGDTGVAGLYDPGWLNDKGEMIVHVVMDPESVAGSGRASGRTVTQITTHEAGHALDHILGYPHTQPGFWDLAKEAFPVGGTHARSNEYEAFAEMFAAASMQHWQEPSDVYRYDMTPEVQAKVRGLMRGLGLVAATAGTAGRRYVCVARWVSGQLVFGPPPIREIHDHA